MEKCIMAERSTVSIKDILIPTLDSSSDKLFNSRNIEVNTNWQRLQLPRFKIQHKHYAASQEIDSSSYNSFNSKNIEVNMNQHSDGLPTVTRQHRQYDVAHEENNSQH